MDHEILAMSAVQLLDRYRDKTLSPVEVTRLNPVVNAFCLVDEETTLALAKESEQRYAKGAAKGLLDGVPVAVKDVFLTPMWPTLKGSKTVQGASTLHKEAPAVAALSRHGYVPLGKTTTPEFGWKGVTDNPVDGVTRNPWNPETTPGGSSGGSSAAVALGMGSLAQYAFPPRFAGLSGTNPPSAKCLTGRRARLVRWPTPGR